MSAGLFGLLDDIATLARMAAASVDDVGAAAGRASAKAAGVVVDDTAVTPQYVRGMAAERELPIIKQIAKGSLRNKLVFILPAALLLSEFLPWLITPILMLGGSYLCFEAMEKIWARLRGHGTGEAHGSGEDRSTATESGAEAERTMIAGAVRTDFILSTEIMVIALNEVSGESFWARAVILAVVAVLITLAVYGVVGLIVKMDDIGLRLAERRSPASRRLGRRLVIAMPALLSVVSVVGVAAMLWVGGHLVVVGADELGWHQPYDALHHLAHEVEAATGALGVVLGWVVTTVGSALAGLLVGALIVLVVEVLPFGRAHSPAAGPAPTEDPPRH